VVLGDVVVEALEAELLVLAAVEPEAGVERVVPLALAEPELAPLPEAAEDTPTVLIGASVLLAAALLVDAALLAGAPLAVVVLPVVPPEPALLCPLLSKPTSVCNRLANSAASPLPMPSLAVVPSLSVLAFLLLPLAAQAPALVLLVAGT
jgi:hypothetical protein